MKSFEEQLNALEKVVEQLESGDLALEDSVNLFEKGVTLSNACKEQLAAAEGRIQVLLDAKGSGPVRVKDLDVAGDDEE